MNEQELIEEIQRLETLKSSIMQKILQLHEELATIRDEIYWILSDLPRLKAGDKILQRDNQAVRIHIVHDPHPSKWGGKVQIRYKEEENSQTYWEDVEDVRWRRQEYLKVYPENSSSENEG